MIPTITQITEKVKIIHELEQDITKCSEQRKDLWEKAFWDLQSMTWKHID